jgi:hypothetical protein
MKRRRTGDINRDTIDRVFLSRFPFGQRFDFYNYFNIGGIEVCLNDSSKICVFTTWLNYQPWEDDPLLLEKTPEELIEWEKSGTRETELDTIIKGLKPLLAQSDDVPVIMGGDFNIWSHLDWQDDTKKQHNDLTVNWWTTSTIQKAGFIDSYRKLHPDAFEYPGTTWNQPGKKDEHRIDYIFYSGEKLVPFHSLIMKVNPNDALKLNGKEFIYPSDHGFVIASFKWKD